MPYSYFSKNDDDKTYCFDEDHEVRQLLAAKLGLDHNEEKDCGEERYEN